MHDWAVEVTVEGFGPSHPLWKRFAAEATAHADTSLEWGLAQPSGLSGVTARIAATVQAESPEAAIRRVMKVVRKIGHRVDRGDQLRWAVTGRATRRAG